MRLIGAKRYPDMTPGSAEVIGVDASDYLAKKTGVTLSSAVWSSEPVGLTFSSQTDTTTQSTALVTVSASASGNYMVKTKLTFSDGAIRNVCAPLRIVCE